jgi:dihydroorotate dehydrogenase (fumarate)
MADLSTTYACLALENPLVASSSPLARDIGKIREMEDSGAAAVILHSLFEEQVTIEEDMLNENLVRGTESFAEALSYFPDFNTFTFAPDAYVEHLRKVKETVDIPVIASLNGVSAGGWVRYAREMEQAGADGLELNIYFLNTDAAVTGRAIEERYIDLVKTVKKDIRIPVSVKLSPFFSSIPNIAGLISRAGADGLALFNRFYQPDIDPERLEVVPRLKLSTSDELLVRIRWVAILFGHIETDLAVTGGVHTSEDVVKSILAGASAVMTTSALLQRGISHLDELKSGLVAWMDKRGFESISQMRGAMSQKSVAEPAAFERANYMKLIGS